MVSMPRRKVASSASNIHMLTREEKSSYHDGFPCPAICIVPQVQSVLPEV